jgi:hypothetical protein
MRMEIVNPVVERDVLDYDFAFTNGMRIQQTLDEGLGDHCIELPDRYKIVLTEKPNATNPEVIMPEEIVTIFKNQVVLLVNRKRKQRKPTEEEMFDMRELLHKLPKSVN